MELNVDPIHWAMVNTIKELNDKIKLSQDQNQKLRLQNEKILKQNRQIKSILCKLTKISEMCNEDEVH